MAHQRVKAAFLRFRASSAAGWTILTISAIWWSVNSLVFQFDPGLSNFLTLISVEASVAASFILAQGNAQQAQTIALMQRQERMVGQVLELTTTLKKLVEELSGDVEAIEEAVARDET